MLLLEAAGASVDVAGAGVAAGSVVVVSVMAVVVVGESSVAELVFDWSEATSASLCLLAVAVTTLPSPATLNQTGPAQLPRKSNKPTICALYNAIPLYARDKSRLEIAFVPPRAK